MTGRPNQRHDPARMEGDVPLSSGNTRTPGEACSSHTWLTIARTPDPKQSPSQTQTEPGHTTTPHHTHTHTHTPCGIAQRSTPTLDHQPARSQACVRTWVYVCLGKSARSRARARAPPLLSLPRLCLASQDARVKGQGRTGQRTEEGISKTRRAWSREASQPCPCFNVFCLAIFLRQ
ncbi:uncharacterized protein LY79DRAFT_367278 [Colletotrichum navitas]|uniref:Uncharacterized protein n=1 Tax=Colletotrichum navitas TaxID=681940 RepID=A0AAD8PRK7_9PEZI|nr:uncharacterized protein LY79DRAFT_367278 [Colletotrichum navitas]KAK1574475.1 hypothetical protein LY79DRAFT_367278 [Colletotrichum navitas]